MIQDENGQSGPNMAGTDSKIDRNLTRPGSPPVLYEVVRADGFVCVPKFRSAYAAGKYAVLMWPDQRQDEDRTGKGWDVQVVGGNE